jgi:FMN phosphatase YigB (HAD superfamily)
MSKKLATLFTLSLMQQAQANKPIILWDIHNVLISRSGVIPTFWNYPDWWNTVKNSSFGLIIDLMGLTTKHLVSGISSEQFIQKARVHNNPYLEKLIIQLTNAQQPILGMKKITDELYERGCEQHIASNIGKTPFLALIDPQQFPHLVPIFEHMDLEKSLVVSDDNGFVKKPDPQFFKIYLEKNNIDPKTEPIIFIDDNVKNIEAAQGVGIDAILFKNPEQVRTELQKRNILIPCTPQKQIEETTHP